MPYLSQLRDRAKKSPRRILLPEGNDERVQEARRIIEKEKIAILEVLTPLAYQKDKRFEEAAQGYFEMRRHKGVTLDEARKTLSEDALRFGAVLTKRGHADGFVAGSASKTSDVVRAAIQCLGVDPAVRTASGSFVMEIPDSSYGELGMLMFADCAVVPDPSSAQLADIAVSTAQLFKKLFGLVPRVAMLSYSTKASADHPMVQKIIEAVAKAKEKEPGLLIDGELQADTALVPEVARRKSAAASSPVAGRANVLIFPDLNSGNIAYKLVQRLAHARAVGPLLQGLSKPASDLSRGCSVDDIVDAVAITAVRAQ